MKYILILLLSILSLITFGQITVTNTQTPDQLVQNVLMGVGVTASNVTYNTSAASAGVPQQNVSFFDATGTTFPITSGVLLTTGEGQGAVGPNNSGSQTDGGTPSVSSDPHLNAIAAGDVENGAVLEFDFVPAGDTISFRYVFGSEEYPEFSPSSFNDAFGFFLWGPGISGPYALAGYPAGGANLALIPGTTTPVTINNILPSDTNYVNNANGAAYGNAIQYDGTTKLFTAIAGVQCGQTYHIKLAICNVGDQSWDSGVFLEASSFSSDAVQIAVATVSGDTAIYEGCSSANIIFTRPAGQVGTPLTVTYDIEGTAINGTDYNTLTSPITFNVGEDTVILSVSPIDDGVSEGPELITITAYSLNECGDTVVTSGEIWILDDPILDIIEQDTILQCKDDSVLVNAIPVGGIGTTALSWSNGATGSPVYVSGSLTGDTEYLVTMTDACNNTFTDTLTVTVIQTLAIDTLMAGPSTCEPTGWVSAMVTGATGVPLYEWTGPGPNSPNMIDATVWENLSPGWYYFTVQDNLCTDFDSVFVDLINPPNAQLSVSPDNGCGPLQVTMTNSSENADTYHWDFGNGQELDISTTESQSQSYLTSATIQLIAYQGTLCSDTAYASVAVGSCGCMDPNALNYNPNATVDNGSCQYPTPTVEAPNVFTPNGDGSNDLFFLNVSNASSVELVILNRWGNVMFEMTGVNPAWNGKTENGTPVSGGVYFYKYTVTGVSGEELEGHGFIELIR
jgi:gliding motility-associated-like protein